MLLHDSLHDAVADVRVDPTSLASSARRRGLGIRRRRRTLAAIGTAAAVAAVALGAAVLPGSGDAPPTVATEAPPPAALSGRTEPISVRGVTAALAVSVVDVAGGRYGALDGDVSEGEATVSLVLEPGDGQPAGQVFLNLQPLSMAGSAPYTCDLPRPLTACVREDLPGGDTLRTYRDSDDEYGAGAERLVAEVISPSRHLRIVLSALNTSSLEVGSYRDEPVLTTEQLVAVASLSWWDRRRLPVELAEAPLEDAF